MAYLGIDVAVGDEEVLVLVVVVIEETRAKGQVGQARLGETSHSAGHGKGAVAAIAVEGVVIVLKMGHQKIAKPVAVVVSIGNAHARLCYPLGTESRARGDAHFAEGVALVAVEEVGRGVVGHVQVWIAVAVVVAKECAESVGRLGLFDVGLAGDIAEGSVAFVAVEGVLCAGEAERAGEYEDALPHSAPRRYALGCKL